MTPGKRIRGQRKPWKLNLGWEAGICKGRVGRKQGTFLEDLEMRRRKTWVGMLEGVGELEDAQDSQKSGKCGRPRQEGPIAAGPAPARSQGALPAAALERPVKAEGKGIREGRGERSAWGAGREGRRDIPVTHRGFAPRAPERQGGRQLG